jgi:hypothetical protein
VLQLSEDIANLFTKEIFLANYFSLFSWLQQLPYLPDMFRKLNEFSLSMQATV